MPKLINLADSKDLTNLMVDLSMLAVWHGCDEEATTLIAWLRHRTDNDSGVIWVDAFRCMCGTDYQTAEALLRELLSREPDHGCAKALLANVLVAAGKPGARELVLDLQAGKAKTDDGTAALVGNVRAMGGMAQPLPSSHVAFVG